MSRAAVVSCVVAAFVALLIAPPAKAVEPKAALSGDLDRALRADLLRAIGEVKAPPASALEARRRAGENLR